MTLTKYHRCARPNAFNMYFDDSRTRDFFMNPWKAQWTQVPNANVKETSEAFTIELAAPGMEKSDFNISVDENTLTISAGRKAEVKNENENYSRREFSYANFSRSFKLTEIVDSEKISATYVNGILNVTIPKKPAETKNDLRKIVVE